MCGRSTYLRRLVRPTSSSAPARVGAPKARAQRESSVLDTQGAHDLGAIGGRQDDGDRFAAQLGAGGRQARDSGGGELGQGRLPLGEVIGEKSGFPFVVLDHAAADEVAQEAAAAPPRSRSATATSEMRGKAWNPGLPKRVCRFSRTTSCKVPCSGRRRSYPGGRPLGQIESGALASGVAGLVDTYQASRQTGLGSCRPSGSWTGHAPQNPGARRLRPQRPALLGQALARDGLQAGAQGLHADALAGLAGKARGHKLPERRVPVVLAQPAKLGRAAVGAKVQPEDGRQRPLFLLAIRPAGDDHGADTFDAVDAGGRLYSGSRTSRVPEGSRSLSTGTKQPVGSIG
jgi:hypothetical protein